jgi:hypothetical protein
VTKFEFVAPYIFKTRFEDAEDEPEDTADNTYNTFVFDTPTAVLRYAPCKSDIIEPGYIEWRLGHELETLLRNWVIPALDLSLTPKGNLKMPDREHLDRCLARLD